MKKPDSFDTLDGSVNYIMCTIDNFEILREAIEKKIPDELIKKLGLTVKREVILKAAEIILTPKDTVDRRDFCWSEEEKLRADFVRTIREMCNQNDVSLSSGARLEAS